MNIGAIVLVFGLLLTGRGLFDMFRSGAVADSNRRRNAKVRSGRSNIPATFQEMRRPHAEDASIVRRQGHNVLYFGLVTVAVGVIVMIFI